MSNNHILLAVGRGSAKTNIEIEQVIKFLINHKLITVPNNKNMGDDKNE